MDDQLILASKPLILVLLGWVIQALKVWTLSAIQPLQVSPWQLLWWLYDNIMPCSLLSFMHNSLYFKWNWLLYMIFVFWVIQILQKIFNSMWPDHHWQVFYSFDYRKITVIIYSTYEIAFFNSEWVYTYYFHGLPVELPSFACVCWKLRYIE